ncbi:MAG: hypothetical protein LUM44_22820 [Pyrinomonadaceae bacterium]|nr:hypothetical protein [Pyrinomonadaceae bacterium]
MDKVLEALDKLLRTCIEFFGVNLTIFFIFAIPILLFLYRIYTDWVKRNEVDAAIKAKDETIQVLAEHNRELRVLHLTQLGWDSASIEAVVMKNTPKDAIEAREMLQKSKPKKGK